MILNGVNGSGERKSSLREVWMLTDMVKDYEMQ